MDVSVLIPWRPGDEHREAALRWVLDRYAATYPDWQIILGTAPEGPWCKALAIADGLERCDGKTLVIADADVWCDDLGKAVERARTEGWAQPHRLVYRLTEGATADVMANGEMPPIPDRRDSKLFTENAYIGWPGGGIVVLPRATYDEVPMDPRFVGWGHEDESWAAALRCLVGPGWRGQEPLWHFWHPPQPRISRSVGSRENDALAHRYRLGHKPPSGMRELIAEVKAWQQPPSSSTVRMSAPS